VLTQIWIALSVYVLVAIMKKKLHLTNLSLYTILQVLSVSLFEKKPILSALVPTKLYRIGPRVTQPTGFIQMLIGQP